MKTALALYRANRAQFWRETALVLAIVAMLPVLACIGLAATEGVGL
jgi:hypothetical protein